MNELVAWEEEPADQREAMLAILNAQIADAHAAVRSRGQTYEMRDPDVVIVSARRVGTALEVTWYGHFRVGHYAQSGSDWNDHAITVKTTTFGADRAIVSEVLLGQRSFNVAERDEDDYDDEGRARTAASAIING